MSGALRDYFRRLDRHLACPRSLRRRLTAQVRRGAEDYLRERPEADPAEVARYLGDPAETARELLENLDPEELRQARRRERLARRALVAVLVLALAAVASWGVHLWRTPLDSEVTETLIIYTDSSEGIS